MLLSNFSDQNRGLSPLSEAGFRPQLVLIPPTAAISRDNRALQCWYIKRIKKGYKLIIMPGY